MDWTFYFWVALAFFVVMAAILGIRYIVDERFKRLEKKALAELEERKISESNSGL